MMQRITLTLMILHLVSILHPVNGIIGYDCEQPANISTISLLEVAECDIPRPEINITSTYIQLLQINEFSSIKVTQCKVEIFRTVRLCGMFSHSMDVPNGQNSYIDDTSRDNCYDMHRYHTTRIGNTDISGLVPNETISRPITIAGTLFNDGKCEGTSYSDPYGTWSNAIVQGIVKITLRKQTALVKTEENKIHLPSGTICEFSSTHCIDTDGGPTFWEPIPDDSCESGKLGVLYEGKADKIEDLESGVKQTIYSLNQGDVIFALSAKNPIRKCGHTLFRTEHPKLLVIETSKNDPFVRKTTINIANLDMFTYVNSKFLYVERHIKTQIQQLYRDILTQQCSIERQMMLNILTTARLSPSDFAYNLMKKPGYTAIMAGEVAHIIACIPVEVTPRHVPTACYNELPISHQNKTGFWEPRTHIILKEGTEISCVAPIGPQFRLINNWIGFGNTFSRDAIPKILKPGTKPTWNYTNIQELATSGIYTQKELERLRNHIMFPSEKSAILNSLARKIAGETTVSRVGSFANLFDNEAIEKILDSTWERTWGQFLKFGHVSAGIIGIIIIFKLIKLIVDTLIHGYALHTVYGWSLYLIGAIWDSLTNLLLHLSRGSPKPGNETADGGNDEPDDDNRPPPPSYYKDVTLDIDWENYTYKPIPFPPDFTPPELRIYTNGESPSCSHTLPKTPKNDRSRYPSVKPLLSSFKQQELAIKEKLDPNVTASEPQEYDSVPNPRPLVSTNPGPSTTVHETQRSDPLPNPRPVSLTNTSTKNEPFVTLYPDLPTAKKGNEETNDEEPKKMRHSYFSLERRPN